MKHAKTRPRELNALNHRNDAGKIETKSEKRTRPTVSASPSPASGKGSLRLQWNRKTPCLAALFYISLTILIDFSNGYPSATSAASAVHHNAPPPVPKKAKKKRKLSSKKPATTRTTTISPKRLSLLRLQREWKDAISAGIAFDWSKGTPVVSKKQAKRALSSKNGSNHETSGTPAAAAASSSSSSHVWIGPLDDRYGLFIWHFTVTGLSGSVYSDGVYHGRVVLPSNYPATPPRVQMLTPSGRFIPGADICLSASQYHPETWQPNAWSVRTLVESLRLHMCSSGMLEIGGMAESYENKLELARESRHWAQQIREGVRVDHKRMIQMGYVATGTASLAEKESKEEETARAKEEESLREGDSAHVLTVSQSALADRTSHAESSQVGPNNDKTTREKPRKRKKKKKGKKKEGPMARQQPLERMEIDKKSGKERSNFGKHASIETAGKSGEMVESLPQSSGTDKPKKKKRRRKKKTQSTGLQHHSRQAPMEYIEGRDTSVLQQTLQQAFANPIRIGIVAFLVVFCFLNFGN